MSRERRSDIITVPNAITSLRIIGTASLLFMDPATAAFFIVYAISGFSDVLDGFIARRCGLTSSLGARLDSIADILLYAVMILKVMPRLIALLPLWIWIYVGGVVAVRLASYITAAVRFHCFASMHTYMNKLTGAAIFCLPFVLLLQQPLSTAMCLVICTIAALSSLEELLIHIISKEYKESRKTIFDLRK